MQMAVQFRQCLFEFCNKLIWQGRQEGREERQERQGRQGRQEGRQRRQGRQGRQEDILSSVHTVDNANAVSATASSFFFFAFPAPLISWSDYQLILWKPRWCWWRCWCILTEAFAKSDPSIHYRIIAPKLPVSCISVLSPSTITRKRLMLMLTRMYFDQRLFPFISIPCISDLLDLISIPRAASLSPENLNLRISTLSPMLRKLALPRWNLEPLR